MYKYKVEMCLRLKNGNLKFPRTEVEHPKMWVSGGDSDLRKLIIKKAASDLGEDPNDIDFSHSNTTIKFLGEVKEEKQNKSKSNSENSDSKPKKSFFDDEDDELSEEELQRLKEKREEEERKRKQLAEKYRNEGKKFIAWVVGMNPMLAFAMFGWPIIFLLFPGPLMVLGILSLLVFALLFLKDILKFSWKIFYIIIASFLVIILSFFFYMKYTRNLEDEKLEKEIEMMINESNNNSTKTNGQVETSIEETEESNIEEYEEVEEEIIDEEETDTEQEELDEEYR